jgi:O-antigen ligase
MYRSVNSMGKVAHNSFISVLVEVGLVGFVIFGIILMIAFFTAWKLPRWDSFFWLTVLMVWTIGASTLTWEFRKTTWLFLSLIIANSALIAHPGEEHSFLQDRAPFASLSSFRRQNTSQTNDAEMKSTE